MKFKKYQKKYKHSYTYGIYPTLDLLKFKPQHAFQVYLSTGEATKAQQEIIDLCRQNKIPFEFNNRIMQKLAIKENTYAIGIFEKYKGQIDQNKNPVVLVNPSDTGNLGTITRIMLGFDFENLAIIRPAVDIFDPKVIRASMGSVFQINFEYFDSFEGYSQRYKNKIYAFMLEGKQNLDQTHFEKPFSLVFGNEGAGLSSEFSKYETIKIPQSSKIDSLNLSISVGIALYEASKQYQ